jgi:hypothetical protein
MSSSEIQEVLGISSNLFLSRIRKGWDPTEAAMASLHTRVAKQKEDDFDPETALAIQGVEQTLDATAALIANQMGVTFATGRKWAERDLAARLQDSLEGDMEKDS